MKRRSHDSPRDALVIVAKYPTPGQVKTRLGASIGFERAAMLYRAFLEDLAARFSGPSGTRTYDLIWACVRSEAPMTTILGGTARIISQRGADFAERLYAICRDMAELGYRRTIILGSDSPHVARETVEEAYRRLDHADVVLGPADDGGYYLVGLRNQPDTPDIFTGIAMSTELVLAQTVQRARELQLSLDVIETTFDVDTEADLLRLARLLESRPRLAPRTQTLLKRIYAESTVAEGDFRGAH